MATRKAASSRGRTATRTTTTRTAAPAEPYNTNAGVNPDQPSESETTRVQQLSASDNDNAGVAQLTAREYFGRVGKNLDAPALIGDIVGFLEHLGVIDAPDSHAAIE